MNEIDLLNADLNDATDGSGSDDSTSVNGDATSGTSVSASDASNSNAEASAPVAAVTVRKGAGRKVDVSGTTALGKARILYSQNPSMTPKQLKQLFETELVKTFPTLTPAVAQTYASLVRRGTKKAA